MIKSILPKKESTLVPVNERLLSIITPMNLTIKSNQIIVGEYTGKVYGAVKYPQKVDYGWLSRLTNISGTALSIGFTPIDNGTFIDSLSKSITLNRGNAESSKEPLTRKRAEQAAIDAEKIMVQLDSEEKQ